MTDRHETADSVNTLEAIHKADRIARFRELLAKTGSWNKAVWTLKREIRAEVDTEKGNSERRSDDAKDAGSER